MSTNDDDDDDKGKKSNGAPVLKPPGFGQNGYAPPGTVGHGNAWVEGPFYIGGHNENPFRRGAAPEATQEPNAPRDVTTPRFHETGDAEIDRHYGQNHVMVRQDGSEMRPADWQEKPASDREAAAPDQSGDEARTPDSDPAHANDNRDLDASRDQSEMEQAQSDKGRDEENSLAKYYAPESEQGGWQKGDLSAEFNRHASPDDPHGRDGDMERGR